jgi:hypothetical protein
MPYDSVHDLLRIIQSRDFFLILLLVVIALLWAWQNRDLRDHEQWMNDHPASKGDFTAWRRQRDSAKLARRPTAVICPLHKVFRDTCPPGSHDEVDDE